MCCMNLVHMAWSKCVVIYFETKNWIIIKKQQHFLIFILILYCRWIRKDNSIIMNVSWDFVPWCIIETWLVYGEVSITLESLRYN
jgi:hypothetical protein